MASIKNAEFPFPTESPSEAETEQVEVGERSEASYVDQIVDLQARLHTKTSQLELANSLCVQQAEAIGSLRAEREASKQTVKKLKSENSVLQRRLSKFEPNDKIAKSGPKLKAFEALTPRQQKVASADLQAQVLRTSEERKILPSRLSAYLTYR